MATDISRLIDAVIFNVLITNVDSHAKNYSIMLKGRGASLAPLYDLMCGDEWPGITKNLSQDIGGQRRGKHIYQRHWRRMAHECGLNGSAVIRRVQQIAEIVLSNLESARVMVEAMPAGTHPMLSSFTSAISRRCADVIANLRVNDNNDDGHAQPNVADDMAPGSF